ncbi:DUF423 domain-containing protein [Phragmitibacter flavus]|uniref:DUF423 domain-containing protein n=1 Tax=Phragmitibacter flavus TaxID=2576071 RepID=A0A5R8K9U1_9BACT|nr:DUF423 domain-containing protein [Phragmitibacter flavus]TLD69037.1 DUF423 domain-containing protein [Phragmitibacter flavus]
MKADPFKLRVAAMLGFLGVSLGAMGAHAMEARWLAELSAEDAARRIDVWGTASFYHMVHAVVLMVMAYVFPREEQGRWTWGCMVLGVVIFSGSLYGYCYTGIRWMGAVTPFGGLLIIIGWLLLALGAGKKAAV